MSTPLYGVTARTANELRRLIADGGRIGGRATSGAGTGQTWVKVTGAATGGWHPGVASIDHAGVWEDLTRAVLVASSDGSTLTVGTRYPCTRTGDDGEKARFRTRPGVGTGVAKHVPRWDSAGDGLENTYVTIGSAGFATQDSALCVYYEGAGVTIAGTTPFMVLDPESFNYGTTLETVSLRQYWATHGVGTGVLMQALSGYPFTSSSFQITSAESVWRMNLSAPDPAHGHADFSAGTPGSQSNMLSTNVLSIWGGHNDASRSDLPTAAAGAYLTYTYNSGAATYTVNCVVPTGGGGTAHFQLNGTDLLTAPGDGLAGGTYP